MPCLALLLFWNVAAAAESAGGGCGRIPCCRCGGGCGKAGVPRLALPSCCCPCPSSSLQLSALQPALSEGPHPLPHPVLPRKSPTPCPALQPALSIRAHPLPRLASQVGVHVLAPAEVLAADPLPDAVAVMQLAVAASAHRAGGVQLPQGAGRLAVFIDGTENDADLAAVKVGLSLLGAGESGETHAIIDLEGPRAPMTSRRSRRGPNLNLGDQGGGSGEEAHAGLILEAPRACLASRRLRRAVPCLGGQLAASPSCGRPDGFCACT